MSILSVSEITAYIKQLFDYDPQLTAVFVRGEISNFKRHHSGHCYFTLKDDKASMRLVMFKSRAQYLKFEPKDGLKVIAGGNITVFDRDGQYQLYVDQLIPAGMGELSLAFEQLKKKLADEGLFDESRKQPLPLLPGRVGVITSPTGAAVRDIISVSKRRHPGIALTLIPVQVQGADAPPQIVKAIELFNTHKRVDVMIVGRGGGTLEELWAFNDERVVRAIARSRIPVVSAVGHQTDFTLADFVADCRAATPSQAAELVVPDVNGLIRYIRNLRDMAEYHIRNSMTVRYNQVVQLLNRRIMKYPQEILIYKQQTVDSYRQSLITATQRSLVDRQHQFQILAEKLAMLNPLSVMARGYGIVRTLAGRVVTKSSEVQSDDILEILLSQGSLEVKVLKTGEENEEWKKI